MIQSSKERRQERLAFWNRRNSGEIHCQIVLRIGFQRVVDDGDYAHAHYYDLYCVLCLNRECVL